MLITIAITLLFIAVFSFLAVDHYDSLRTWFGFASKNLLPPLNFNQWTVIAFVIAIVAVAIAIMALGVVAAGHRLTCNAYTLSEWLKR